MPFEQSQSDTDDRSDHASDPVPRHVAIIMDGNGRWAAARGLPRREGHRRGVETLRKIVRHAGDRGVEYLTLYSFSSENWSRPREEVQDLLNLLRRFIRRDLNELVDKNVHIRIIGSRTGLPDDIHGMLSEAESRTANNTGLKLAVAFNYGARDEITRAVKAIAQDVLNGDFACAEIDESTVDKYLDTAGIPDPDLVIRTSGEQRISNFLLWQSAYSEFVFLPGFWPDFDSEAFDGAIAEFGVRERRYGSRNNA